MNGPGEGAGACLEDEVVALGEQQQVHQRPLRHHPRVQQPHPAGRRAPTAQMTEENTDMCASRQTGEIGGHDENIKL